MAWGNEQWNENNWNFTSGGVTGPSGPAVRQTTGEAERQALLGKDLFFEGDYSVGQNRDYVLLSGIPALRQAIIHRLITNPGEFKTRPTYGVGVRTFVKKPKTNTNIQLLKRKIEEQLLEEPRVEEVLDIVVETIQDGIKIQVKIRAAGKELFFEPFLFNELGSKTLKV